MLSLSPTAKWGWDQLDEQFRIYTDGVLFSEVGYDNGFFTKDGVRVTDHVVWSCVDEGMAHGARYFYNTHAEQLVGDAETGITGVVATNEDGDYVQFNAAKGVILATGDISGNQEMIDCWAPIANRADNCEELAELLGVPADNLVATVERYNSMCDKGVDTDFGVPERFLSPVKTAPFYAKKIPAITLVVPFGLHVNNDSQVCTAESKPIAGLFAVGNAQGEFFAYSYPVHCPGLSHGRAITFGQLVGEALAKGTVLTALED